mmetsp:Transcript_41083/g.124073  ORF Transcript_41083/g.124073 Transcript_41083/m.124073 type:complete len:329 (-) Transcript_41083:1852-2838(-)
MVGHHPSASSSRPSLTRVAICHSRSGKHRGNPHPGCASTRSRRHRGSYCLIPGCRGRFRRYCVGRASSAHQAESPSANGTDRGECHHASYPANRTCSRLNRHRPDLSRPSRSHPPFRASRPASHRDGDLTTRRTPTPQGTRCGRPTFLRHDGRGRAVLPPGERILRPSLPIRAALLQASPSSSSPRTKLEAGADPLHCHHFRAVRRARMTAATASGIPPAVSLLYRAHRCCRRRGIAGLPSSAHGRRRETRRKLSGSRTRSRTTRRSKKGCATSTSTSICPLRNGGHGPGPSCGRGATAISKRRSTSHPSNCRSSNCHSSRTSCPCWC